MPFMKSKSRQIYSTRPKKVSKVATVPQVKSIVKRALHKDEEEKYAIVQASYSVSTTAGIYSLANTSQGSSGGTHIGDECRLKSIWFRWQTIVADTYNVVRIIVFVWKPNIGFATPAALNILKTVTTPNQLTTCYNEDGEDMYHILYDNVIPMVTGNTNTKVGKFQKRLNLKQDFLTGSSNCSNNIYVLLISDSGAAADPTVNFTSRIAFTDA